MLKKIARVLERNGAAFRAAATSDFQRMSVQKQAPPPGPGTPKGRGPPASLP
jgi:hypothetical protein